MENNNSVLLSSYNGRFLWDVYHGPRADIELAAIV